MLTKNEIKEIKELFDRTVMPTIIEHYVPIIFAEIERLQDYNSKAISKPEPTDSLHPMKHGDTL